MVRPENLHFGEFVTVSSSSRMLAASQLFPNPRTRETQNETGLSF